MENTSNTWEVPASQKVSYNHVSAFMAKADAIQIKNGISYKSKRKTNIIHNFAVCTIFNVY